MEDRLKKLEREVSQQAYLVLVVLILTILNTAALLVLWGERGEPDYDHIAVSLTVFQTMFAIAAIYGFWALRGLTREKAEETAAEEVAKIVPPIANRAISEFLRTLGAERTISDEDLAKLVEAAGEEDDNGK